ncbi:hypothetical protein [Tardiphaga robiniae]|uniref:DUF5050 domain-containing protein n=1 Tax=Tardiphaga robiniae TaxID=943830 RepID=A0A161R882_9BRAD|nr:hypothetical protein [Tardiphaga robiniae]KZD25651.1 hypothetical protein A4A58_04420 [Tardiphaga robiniae]
MGDVTVINLSNAPINAGISAVFNYNWRNVIPPGQYVVLDAKGVVTLSVKWGLGASSYITSDSMGIGFFTVGTVLAVAGLVLALPTAGASLTLMLTYTSLAVAFGSIPVGVLGFAVKDFVNSPYAVTGIELRRQHKYVVEGEIKINKGAVISGETKGKELKLREVSDKEFKELQAKGVSPMDLAYEVGHDARTISTPFVTTDGWIWFQDPNNALMRISREGTKAAEHIGGHYVSSNPVVFGDWVYFLGLNGVLMRMKTDGSVSSDIGGHISLQIDTGQGWAPSVDSNGRVWYWGKSGALMWSNQAGTDGGNPGGTFISSHPVVFGDWVYFLGLNGALMRMKTDGSASNEIGDRMGPLGTGGDATPLVDGNGWVWYWGKNGAVMKTNQAGTVGENPGGAYSAAPPVVFDNLVYYEGLNGNLMCMMTDGSSEADLKVTTQIGGTPFVASDGWVFFRGRDNVLMKACFYKSPQLRGG